MKLLDTVALIEDLPELKIYRGQVGTIVEEYEPNVFKDGRLEGWKKRRREDYSA